MDMVKHGEVWALKLVPLSESERSPTILLLSKEGRGKFEYPVGWVGEGTSWSQNPAMER